MPLRSALVPFFAAFALAVGACEKSAPAEEEPPPAPPVVITSADVVGRWFVPGNELRDAAYNWIKFEVEDSRMRIDDNEIERHVDEIADLYRANPPTYTFDPDGTFTFTAGDFKESGTWTLKKDVLTLTAPESDDERFRVEPGFLRTIPGPAWERVISMVRG